MGRNGQQGSRTLPRQEAETESRGTNTQGPVVGKASGVVGKARRG